MNPQELPDGAFILTDRRLKERTNKFEIKRIEYISQWDMGYQSTLKNFLSHSEVMAIFSISMDNNTARRSGE